VLVVEGVMGLFDGANDGTPSSTHDVAGLIQAPIVLVVDASAMSTSVAAMVHGYSTYRNDQPVSAVILNHVGSPAHATLLEEALAPLGIPVLGALPRDERLQWRDRHLGLVPVAENSSDVRRSLHLLAALIEEHVDLEAVMTLARSAPTTIAGEVPLPRKVAVNFRVAIASGAAFTFTYQDTLDALRAAGAEIASFDPLRDESLPEGIDGLIVGGGFPEVYAAELACNRGLLDSVRAQVLGGLPTWAECGGLLLMCRDLDGKALAGAVDAEARMTTRLTLGYRIGTTNHPSPIGPAGTAIRGHEFHYSTVEPGGDALTLSSRWGTRDEGWATPTLLATYLHHHPGGDPGVVAAFARACTLRHTQRLA
jgi:cobyrinic acid a,c-diamide synthase